MITDRIILQIYSSVVKLETFVALLNIDSHLTDEKLEGKSGCCLYEGGNVYIYK